MDIKAQITKITDTLAKDKNLYEQFQKEPVKALEKITGLDLPDEIVQPIIDGEPAKIFILGGVNDVSHSISADSIATAMRNLVRKIKVGTPCTKIYLQSLLPIDNSFKRYKNLIGKEQVIVDANVLLKKMAEEEDIVWIDLFSKMVDPATGAMRKGLSNDGLHLLGEGYFVWRDAVLPYVNE